ncbi:nucleotidyltransferase domain-containing protein [Candidatus Woesearchaeota archaeon]|nr:nucleotidyltransferase domain-containing protein [Candidatus Woesearchaeota archaeon]
MLLDTIIDSKNKIAIVRELSNHENWEYTISELAKETRIHRVRVSGTIKYLADMGVIKIKTKGKIKLISINKENYLVKNIIINLFEKEKNLAFEIADDIVRNMNKERIISVILFGSAIKKDFRFNSDIDLMILYDKKINNKRIERIIEEYNKKGLLISYDSLDIKEFKKFLKEKEPSIVTLIKDNKVVYGKKILELI